MLVIRTNKKLKGLWELLFAKLRQSFKIIYRNGDVKVVVPRDKAVMPDRAYAGSACGKITDVVFVADFLYLDKNLEDLFLQFNCFCTHIIHPESVKGQRAK